MNGLNALGMLIDTATTLKELVEISKEIKVGYTNYVHYHRQLLDDGSRQEAVERYGSTTPHGRWCEVEPFKLELLQLLQRRRENEEYYKRSKIKAELDILAEVISTYQRLVNFPMRLDEPGFQYYMRWAFFEFSEHLYMSTDYIQINVGNPNAHDLKNTDITIGMYQIIDHVTGKEITRDQLIPRLEAIAIQHCSSKTRKITD